LLNSFLFGQFDPLLTSEALALYVQYSLITRIHLPPYKSQTQHL
jgi:hypothetical protein